MSQNSRIHPKLLKHPREFWNRAQSSGTSLEFQNLPLNSRILSPTSRTWSRYPKNTLSISGSLGTPSRVHPLGSSPNSEAGSWIEHALEFLSPSPVYSTVCLVLGSGNELTPSHPHSLPSPWMTSSTLTLGSAGRGPNQSTAFCPGSLRWGAAEL